MTEVNKDGTIEIVFQSPSKDGVWTVADLRKELDRLSAVIKQFSDNDSDVELVSITKNSPLTAKVRPITSSRAGKKRKPLPKATTRLMKVASSLEAGNPGTKNVRELRAIQEFTQALVNENNIVTFTYGKQVVQFDKSFAEKVEKSLGYKYFEVGTWVGELDVINIRRRTVFWLTYPFGNRRIKCIFKPSDMEPVRQALGQVIEVFGKLQYNSEDPYPVTIEVESLRVLQESTDEDWQTLINHTVGENSN